MTKEHIKWLVKTAYANSPFRYGDELYAIIDGEIRTVRVIFCQVGASPDYFNIQTLTDNGVKGFSSTSFGKTLFETEAEAIEAL